MKKALVIAPHPDDEILGVGATMSKMVSAGNEVYVCVVTKGTEPKYSKESVLKTRKETIRAHEILGVTETFFLDFPAAELDRVPEAELGKSISDLVQRIKPDVLFIPFSGDVHFDHQKVALACMVAARPHREFYPEKIYAYETLSETNWNAPYLAENFVPNVYVDITGFVESKIKAMKCFESQLYDFPHERSIESIEVLAKHRGCTINRPAAEAFVLIRDTNPL